MDGRKDRVGCDDAEVPCEVCGKKLQIRDPIERPRVEDSWIRQGSQETTVFGGDSTEEEEEKEEEEEDEDDAELAAAQSERRAISQRRQRVVKKEAMEVTVLQEYLEEVRGTCPYCRWELEEKKEHVLYRCNQRGAFNAKNRYKILQRLIRSIQCMAMYSGCHECFVPIEWCDRFVGIGKGSDGGAKQEWIKRTGRGLCQYDELVLSEYVVLVEDDKEFIQKMEQRITKSGFEGKRNEDRVRYFGQREEWGGIEANKMLRELIRAIIVFHE